MLQNFSPQTQHDITPAQVYWEFMSHAKAHNINIIKQQSANNCIFSHNMMQFFLACCYFFRDTAHKSTALNFSRRSENLIDMNIFFVVAHSFMLLKSFKVHQRFFLSKTHFPSSKSSSAGCAMINRFADLSKNKCRAANLEGIDNTPTENAQTKAFTAQRHR